MLFKVEFAELAAEKFRKLPHSVQDQIAKKLRQVAEKPRRFLVRLTDVEGFRLRIGDYRLVLDVDWKSTTLYVLTLGHRSTVYR